MSLEPRAMGLPQTEVVIVNVIVIVIKNSKQ